MDLFDLYSDKKAKPRRAKTLLERSRKYVGVDRTPGIPADASARTKQLIHGRLAAKRSR